MFGHSKRVESTPVACGFGYRIIDESTQTFSFRSDCPQRVGLAQHTGYELAMSGAGRIARTVATDVVDVDWGKRIGVGVSGFRSHVGAQTSLAFFGGVARCGGVGCKDCCRYYRESEKYR